MIIKLFSCNELYVYFLNTLHQTLVRIILYLKKIVFISYRLYYVYIWEVVLRNNHLYCFHDVLYLFRKGIFYRVKQLLDFDVVYVEIEHASHDGEIFQPEFVQYV